MFVQQFSDLYLSEVMGVHKGRRVEAQAPRELYFTQEAMAISHTHAHTHSYGYDGVEPWAQAQACWNIAGGDAALWMRKDWLNLDGWLYWREHFSPV